MPDPLAADLALDILREIGAAVRGVDPAALDRLIAEIAAARRMFCLGVGRSGILLAAFCMRLDHLGLAAFKVGGLPCPPASAGDLIVAASGSATTASVLAILEKGRSVGARVALLTASDADPQTLPADAVIRIPAPTGLVNHDSPSRQPMRSLFEQTVFIACEAVVRVLIRKLGQSDIAMAERHANLG